MRPRLAMCGALAASASWACGAFAHGEVDRERVDRSPMNEAPSAGDEAIAPANAEVVEPRFTLGLDVVVGFGKTLAADQAPPGSLDATPVDRIESDPVQTNSFLFSATYRPLHRLRLRARLPLVVGSILPDGYQSRPVSALGNVEVEAESSIPFSKSLALVYALGVGVPTGQGTEVPGTTAALATRPFDPNAYDRYSILYAAAASRGFEENTLFFPGRFGIVPKITLECRALGRVRVEPFVELENMISTSGDNASGYLADLVLGARAGYRANEWFEPGLRIWTAFQVAGGDDTAVLVVEPELRLHLGVLSLDLGLLLPVAGPLARDPSQFVGVRLAAALAP